MSADELKAKLTDRIRVYEESHADCDLRDAVSEDQASIVDAVESAIGFYWPYSAYAILRALRWTLEKGPPDGWWRELDVLLHSLNVRRELPPGTMEGYSQEYGEDRAAQWRRQLDDCAAFWLEEVSKWPIEDYLLIHEWLTIAKDWPFVKEVFCFDVYACLSFWSGAIAGRQT